MNTARLACFTFRRLLALAVLLVILAVGTFSLPYRGQIMEEGPADEV
jgi:hypothetical protein